MEDFFEKTVSRLERDADAQYRRAITAETEVKRLTDEVDRLRNVNAGLRKDNERLTTALEVWMR